MHRIIYNIAIISVLLTLANCANKEAKNTEIKIQDEAIEDTRIFVTKAQFERGKMTLGHLEEKGFPTTVKTSGMIDVPPENRVVVNATMGGYIKTAPYLIGDKVHKGQALVSIENSEFVSIQQEYMEVNEQLTYLKSEFERQKTMLKENITSQKSFLKSESDYKTAKARHNGLRKQLQMLNISVSSVEAGNMSSVATIYAPITGSITKVNITRGTYVSPATAILEIVDNNHIHVELSVFEKDIMKLKKGQKINFTIPESSQETYYAVVHLIGTSIEDNRTIKVHGHIENQSETAFLVGMFVEADIITNSVSAKSLPETAVVAKDNTYLVLKLSEETTDGFYFEQVPVKIGKIHKGDIAITSFENLTTKDRILTKGSFNLIADN